MFFDMIFPCPKCPFRTDVPGYLRQARAAEIAHHVAIAGSGFPCHETTEDEEGEDGFTERVCGPRTRHCAGALIFLFHVLPSLGTPEAASQLAVLRMLVDAGQLRMDAPVFTSIAAFIAHHNAGGEYILMGEITAQADG